MSAQEKILLILDLDEVLIYATADPNITECDFTMEKYKIQKRPYTETFLREVSSLFMIAVWTHATSDYADVVIRNTFPSSISLEFVWTRKRCTLVQDTWTKEKFYLKDLKKVKRRRYDLKRILVIEDDPRAMQRSYGNLIAVTPFKGDCRDHELRDLAGYLRRISSTRNVRRLEKRGWRYRLKSSPTSGVDTI